MLTEQNITSKYEQSCSTLIVPGDFCITIYSETSGWKNPQAEVSNDCIITINQNDIVLALGNVLEVTTVAGHPDSLITHEWTLVLCKDSLAWVLSRSFHKA